MEITNEQIGQRFAWKERNGLVKYGTLKEVTGSFGNMNVDGSSRQNYFVPLDTCWLVDEDNLPIQE